MIRIVMLVIRGIFSLPSWYRQLRKVKGDENATLQDRYNVARKICAWIIRHGNIEPVITGLENLPKESGYLIAPNHQGLYDAVQICNSHPTFTTAIVKIELENTFFVKDLIQLLKAYPMDRQNLRQSMKIIRAVTDDMKNGINCIIFPEGTRSKQGNTMGEFKGGTFKSAVNAKAPIVPVCLIDCFKVFDQNSISKVSPQIHYLKPIYFEEYEDLSTNEIADLVKSRIQAKMDEVLK